MKKILIVLLSLMLITGCSKAEEPSVKEKPVEVATETKEEEVIEEISEEIPEESEMPEDFYEPDFGTMKFIHSTYGEPKIYESGPFVVTVEGIVIGDYEPEGTMVEFLDNPDIKTAIFVYLNVENTSDETLSIYPDQSKLVTNTKEQVDSDIWTSEDVGGDFIGQVIKNGAVVYYLKSPASEITDIKIVIGAPHGSSFSSLGEDIVIEETF